MLTLFSSFHFIRPHALWALLPLLIVLWGLIKSYRQLTNWQKVCDDHLLKQLIIGQNNPRHFWPLLLLGISWFFAVFALAGPSWSQLQQPMYQNLNAAVIVLDVSIYMDATDQTPSRLTRAKYKALDILKLANDTRFGLVAFTSEPFVVSPLTQDAATISLLIPDLETAIMPVQGSNISKALEQGALLLKNAGENSGDIFLLTASPVNKQDINTAKQLAKENIKTSVLGVGTTDGAPIPNAAGGFVNDKQGAIILSKLDREGLQKLAAAGKGRFVQLSNTNSDIDYLLAPSITIANLQHANLTKNTITTWVDQGRWFLLIPLSLMLLLFRRGWFEDALS